MIIDALGSYFFYAALILGLVAIVACFRVWRGRRELTGRIQGGTIIGLIGLIVAVGVVALTLAIANTAPSGKCRGCHEMEPEYRTWKASRHSKVECLACHLEPVGVIDFLAHDVRSLSEVWHHVTGDYPTVINNDSSLSQERMRSSSCLRCHLVPARSRTKLLIMDHREHSAVQCQVCHNRIAHKGAQDFPYLDGMGMMSGCMRCHLPGREKTVNGRKAPSRCTTCHPRADWPKAVFGTGKVDAESFDDCRACHKIRDAGLVRQYDSSKMFKEGVDCSDCHNSHFKKFVSQPENKTCSVCHPKAAGQVISGRMGFKGYKPPFKKPAEVRCGLCHKAHVFKPVKPKS